MNELNFCPSCETSSHKIVRFNEKLCFCKGCNSFYNLDFLDLKCPKCNNAGIKTSDFPSPSGELVFQCEKCKKMINASKFFKNNKVKV